MTSTMIDLYLHKETIKIQRGDKPTTFNVLLLEEKMVYLRHGQLIIVKLLKK